MKAVEYPFISTQDLTGFQNLLGPARIDLSGFQNLTGLSISTTQTLRKAKQKITDKLRKNMEAAEYKHVSRIELACIVHSKGSLTTKSGGEFEIRNALIDNDLLECVVNLPTKLLLNTQIPACLWFLRRAYYTIKWVLGNQKDGVVLPSNLTAVN